MSLRSYFKAEFIGSVVFLSQYALGQALNKPVLFSDGLSPHVDSVFWGHLNPTQSTWDEWGWGWIPQACMDAMAGSGFSPYDIEVYNVHYTDCSSAWVICRHHDAQMSVIDMIDAFGREPVHDRQWTQHILALPQSSCTAGTINAVTTFYGDCYVPSVFTHEMSHTLDQYAFDTANIGDTGDRFSTTSTYSNAINEDSCVPDPYSNTNVEEDFAQVSVLALYEKVNPGGLDPIGNWRCLVNQKNSLDSIIGNQLTPGGSCTRRWPDSTIVSMGPAAGNSKRSVWSKRTGRTAGPKPTPANKVGDPLVVDTTPDVKATTPPLIDVFPNLNINQTARREAAIRINDFNAAVGKPTVVVPN